jgi:hypothetical protein
MKLRPHDTKQLPLFQQAAHLVRPCGTLLDIGCGIRPQNLVTCERHTCVEPHFEYADALEQNGFAVIRSEANDAIKEGAERFDTIVALDVIEHMTREDGERFIELAKGNAKQQVVIFTPLGFMPQDGGDATDPWGMQGQEWQQHRSGWTPYDFIGWKIVTDPAFHHRNGVTYGAFFAVYG